MYFEWADQSLKRLKKEIRREFNHLSVLSIDEINALRTKKETTGVYNRLKAQNQKEYLKIAKSAYREAEAVCADAGFQKNKGKVLDAKWMLAVLAAYNLVTGYLYEKEADRKRLRTAEEMLTARAYLNVPILRRALRRSADLWYTQTAQYADTVTDEAVLEAYRAYGVQFVRWKTAADGNVCKICRERDGQIYPINDIPPRPHYHCRCILEPVHEDKA